MNPVINFHKKPSLLSVKSWMTTKGFSVNTDGKTQLDLQKGKLRIVFECVEKPLLPVYTCVTVYDEGRSRKFETEEIKLSYINKL